MLKINEHYLKLKASYLFSDIGKRVEAFQNDNPGKEIIKLGIGDVTLPLPQSCIDAFHAGVDEMAKPESFHGYGPEQGYAFLRDAIAENDYASCTEKIRAEEIFISDGSKCDTGNFQELFAADSTVAIPDPVYPVYVDTNVMAGRTGANTGDRYDGLVYLDGTEENGFVPAPPKERVDLIYLCFPNNPTGATATKTQLKAWVDYANDNGSLILFDAAYAAFIRDESIPKSIYEIEGARTCAVEFRSFSKNAGFTGTRCAFTVVPMDITVSDSKGEKHSLHRLWNRRHSTKFNGVSYPVQKAAHAVYSAQGKKEVQELTDYYLQNARIILTQMKEMGYSCTGGENSPYIWIRSDRGSWEFFDYLLNKTGVVCTPGAGFGSCGEGYIRISAFNMREKVEEAMQRIAAL
ncbi:MAG: LL-diaminopimelate aminotransferase [Spirochaetota bacterium]